MHQRVFRRAGDLGGINTTAGVVAKLRNILHEKNRGVLPVVDLIAESAKQRFFVGDATQVKK